MYNNRTKDKKREKNMKKEKILNRIEILETEMKEK